MKESVTYQAIVEEGRTEGIQKGIQKGIQQGLLQGRVEEAQRLLLRLGIKRFGILSEQNHAAITAIVSLDRLEELNDRLVDAESWQELLQDL